MGQWLRYNVDKATQVLHSRRSWEQVVVVVVVVISRVFYTVLALIVSYFIQPFDGSAHSHSIFERWDVLHFSAIATHSYRWEHQFAFLPASPFLLRYFSPFTLFLFNSALALNSTTTLYHLSLHHLTSHHTARLATLLSLIPFSPPTLYLAPYAEPFFTYLSYKGMLSCARQQWFLATFFFTIASTFRSNGFFLAGFIIWGTLFQKPSLSSSLTAILSTASILTPFIAHNLFAYHSFCLSPPSPDWCTHPIPLIYNYVQSSYWNVGFLRYWSLQQLPNFLIAFPPLFAFFSYSLTYLHHYLFITTDDPFFNKSIAPHAIHALFLSSILLFASHTQIVLRLAPSMPFTYWAAAYILTHPNRFFPFVSRAWLPSTFIWSLLSVVLWVAFLPPA